MAAARRPSPPKARAPRPLRLAVAGAGGVGQAHVARIQQHPACELAALADPSPGVQALADQARVPRYAALQTLLDAERPDGVILATPNALHLSGALACLDAGVAVLVEKPVTDTLDQAAALVAAQAASGVPLLVGHHRRHSVRLQQACDAIAGGALGRLVAVSGSATFAKPARYFTEAPWRTQPGAGPILINLVHEIDSLRLLMGDIVSVQAMASNAVRGHAVEDSVALTLRFASGALGSFLLSDCAAAPRSWEQTSGENPAYDPHAEQDCYVIAGTRGSLCIPTMRQYRYEGEASWYEPLRCEQLPVAQTLAGADPLLRQLSHFCAVIRGEQSPRVTAQDAMKTLQATLAVAEAAASGQTVFMPA